MEGSFPSEKTGDGRRCNEEALCRGKLDLGGEVGKRAWEFIFFLRGEGRP